MPFLPLEFDTAATSPAASTPQNHRVETSLPLMAHLRKCPGFVLGQCDSRRPGTRPAHPNARRPPLNPLRGLPGRDFRRQWRRQA